MLVRLSDLRDVGAVDRLIADSLGTEGLPRRTLVQMNGASDGERVTVEVWAVA